MGAPRMGNIPTARRHHNATVVRPHSLVCKIFEPRGVVFLAEIAHCSSLHLGFHPYAGQHLTRDQQGGLVYRTRISLSSTDALIFRVLRAFGDYGNDMGVKLHWPVTTQREQWLCCEQEPPAQKVDLGAPKHGPLQLAMARLSQLSKRSGWRSRMSAAKSWDKVIANAKAWCCACKVRQELRVSICLFPRLLQHHTPHGLLVHGLTPFLPAPVYHLERLIPPVHLDTQKQMDSKAQLTLSPGAVWGVGTMATCVIRTCAIFSTRIVP